MIGYNPLDYVNRYIQFSLARHKAYWNALWNIHPSKGQWNYQQHIAGLDPTGLYERYMVARSKDEKTSKTLDYYNLDWSDITYPWLSDLSGGNTQKVLGSATWQFSQNMKRLYR